MYYKYTDVDDITFEFTDIQEGPAKRRKIIYSIVLTAAVVADAFYLIMIILFLSLTLMNQY